MRCITALAALALLSVALALPVEDSWGVDDVVPEDSLVQSRASAPAAKPAPVVPATPAASPSDAATQAKENKMIADANAKAHADAKAMSVKHAADKAKAEANGAAKAAKIEADWTAKETEYAKQAKVLNKEARKAQRDMHDSLAKDKKDLKAEELSNTKKIAETNKGTAAAEQEYKILQSEYKKQIADLKNQDRIEAGIAAKKAAAYKKEMQKVHKEMQGEVKETKKAQKAIITTAKHLAKKKKDIKINYTTKVKQLDEKAKQDRHKLEAEQTAEEKKFAKAMKNNRAKAAAAKKAVADEAAKNAQVAKAAQAEIADRSAKEAKAKAKAAALYKAKTTSAAAALAASRESVAKKFQKQSDDADLQYKKAMEKADSLKAKAAHAMATYNQAVADAKKEEAATEAKTAAIDAANAEVSACSDKQCVAKDGSCAAVNKKTGPWISADLVTCTMKKPKEQQYAGESWAGIPPPAPLKPFPPPTPDCLAKRKAFMATEYGKAITPNVCPTVSVACHKVPASKLHEKKKAFIQYFEMAAACPPWCVPGSATSDGDNQDTHGICITGEDVNIYKQQIADLPEWKAMGTNNKIPGNFGIISMCKMAKNFLAGFMDGAGH